MEMDNGLIKGHAYSITKVKLVSEKFARFLCVLEKYIEFVTN